MTTLATEDGRYAEKIRRAAALVASWPSDPPEGGGVVVPHRAAKSCGGSGTVAA